MRRILIVEDDPDLRELLTLRARRRKGSGSTRPASVPRRCASASGRPPDLVLLDLMLPDFSGLEICRALRRAPETEDVPIIFLTACGADADRIQGLEVGADDYVSKPFQMRELTLRIQALSRRTDPRIAASPPLVSDRVVRREQLRVWEGFAANHMGRAEWHEAREIWRAILARFESDLSPIEVSRVRAQIDGCERALSGAPPGT